MVRRGADAFLLALQFLTIVRVRAATAFDARTAGDSLGWFPAVGLLIGITLLAVDWAARWLAPVGVASALVLAAGVAITGALHYDGLADSADGLFGGRTPERRLEIMRDSRIGSFGMIAVALALLLGYSALASLSGRIRGATLVLTPTIARYTVTLAILAFPYARPTGLGRMFRDGATWRSSVLGGVLLILLIAPSPFLSAIAGLSALGLALGIGRFATSRLGGLTGDIYGAIIVSTEVLMLVIAAAAQHHGVTLGWAAGR